MALMTSLVKWMLDEEPLPISRKLVLVGVFAAALAFLALGLNTVRLLLLTPQEAEESAIADTPTEVAIQFNAQTDVTVDTSVAADAGGKDTELFFPKQDVVHLSTEDLSIDEKQAQPLTKVLEQSSSRTCERSLLAFLSRTDMDAGEISQFRERGFESCYWRASLVMSGLDQAETSACEIVEDGVNLGDQATEVSRCTLQEPPGLFTMARGTEGRTTSLRVKLNTRQDEELNHLRILADLILDLHLEQNRVMPLNLLTAILAGDDFKDTSSGIPYKFSREFGEVPRYNFTMTFPDTVLTELSPSEFRPRENG